MKDDTPLLNGTLGQPAHFHDDYFFCNTPLPNDGTMTSEEHLMNNTLGALIIKGILDSPLTVPASKELLMQLQYRDESGTWLPYHQLHLASNIDLQAGELFEFVPAPDTVKRIFRIVVTADFDASAATLTCPIELIP